VATTQLPPESDATQQQYAAQLLLTAALIQALRQLWGATLPLDSSQGRERFRGGAFALIQHFSGAASSVAMDFYRASRLAAGVTDALPPHLSELVPTPPRSLVDASLEWALRDAERDMARDLAEIEARFLEEDRQWLARFEASAQKAVTDTGRAQVIAAVEGDEKALGFRRVPRPGACYFCIVLALRSTTRTGLAKDFKKYAPGTMGGERHYGVYKSRGTAGGFANVSFEGEGTAKFHNNCHCVIEPVFSPVESLPDWLTDVERLYDETEGGLAEFRRAVAARRRGEDPEPPPLPAVLAAAPNREAIAALLDLLPQVA
jgi:hypothetical protein